MIKGIDKIEVGKSYACKFKTETMLDELGRPPGLSDVPIKGVGTYEGFGVIMQRDSEQKLVLIKDEASKKEFVVKWAECYDIDDVEWVDPL
tara:strand:+ start:668 stop:940 length:273 start_codon:yes stop_codon:yes gene_type:complete